MLARVVPLLRRARPYLVAITAAFVAVSISISTMSSENDNKSSSSSTTTTATSSSSSSATPTPTSATLSSVARPTTFFVLGAAGRTGLPFLRQALERGHTVHAYVRNPDKIQPSLRSSPLLHIHVGSTYDTAIMTSAIELARPTVIYCMLASDPKPHDAISSGTRSVIQSLTTIQARYKQQINDQAKDHTNTNSNTEQDTKTTSTTTTSTTWDPHSVSFISIAGWGIVPQCEPYLSWFDKRLVSLATSLLFAAPGRDMVRQFDMLSQARTDGVLPRYTLIMPPLLTNGALTRDYVAGDLTTVHDLKLYNTISRENMAHFCLVLGEQAANGQHIPTYAPIRSR